GDGYEALMTADYSQIEMRIMAHLSGAAGLIEAFTSGEDLHTYVASKAFNLPIESVDPELRRRSKAMSYGLAYGLPPYALAQQLGLTPGSRRGCCCRSTTSSCSRSRRGSGSRSRSWCGARWPAPTHSARCRSTSRSASAAPGTTPATDHPHVDCGVVGPMQPR